MNNSKSMIPGFNKQASRFAEVKRAENISATIKRIWSYFKQEKLFVLSMLIVVIFGTLCGIFAPTLQSKAIDIIAKESNSSLSFALILMLITYLIYGLCQLLQGFISAKLSQNIVKKLREELFGKIIDLQISYVDNHSSGDIMSRMTNDIENISNTVSQSLPSLFSGILTIIGTVLMMLIFCWQLALLSCTTVILTVLATKLLSKSIRKYSRKRQNLLGKLNGTVEEMVSGYKTVVAYNHQEITIKDFCETSDSLTESGIKTDVFSGIMGPIMNCIGNIGFVIISAFGGYFAIKGYISVGIISAFIVYAKQFSRPINEIAQIYGQLQTAIAGAERVFNILDEANEEISGENLKTAKNTTVTFKNVNFSYDNKKNIIKNFNLKIPAGKKVALVGATGSGKTTIVNLLMRFYDINSGEIFINNQNIKDISRESLRHNIAIVLQDTVLFSNTISHNLKYANESASPEQIQKAVSISHCQEMIEALPNGYETILTSSGANISQGQRQLLAIARAFIADPKILILDEATSNVDTKTEKNIQDAMQQVMKDRTSIIIAHRLSTIRDADIIVVMDQGEIVEMGTHDKLISQKGKYYELYMTQYAGFAI